MRVDRLSGMRCGSGLCWVDRLNTLKLRLNFCDKASCWFKRRLSVVKRFKNAGALVFRLGSCRGDCWVDRLNSLKFFSDWIMVSSNS